jgi:hypothetical protein
MSQLDPALEMLEGQNCTFKLIEIFVSLKIKPYKTHLEFGCWSKEKHDSLDITFTYIQSFYCRLDSMLLETDELKKK